MISSFSAQSQGAGCHPQCSRKRFWLAEETLEGPSWLYGCNQKFVFQHLTRSTRFINFCSSFCCVFVDLNDVSLEYLVVSHVFCLRFKRLHSFFVGTFLVNFQGFFRFRIPTFAARQTQYCSSRISTTHYSLQNLEDCSRSTENDKSSSVKRNFW